MRLLDQPMPEPEERDSASGPRFVGHAGPHDGHVPLLNIANVLTVMRIALVPVFAVLLVMDGTGARLAAFAVFALAGLTDRVDGQIARSRGLVTRFGTVADPIADKALIGAALIGLSLIGELWWWVTVVVLVRELGITLLRITVSRHGDIPSSRGGKLKTMLQGVAIGMLLLPLGELFAVAGAVVMAAAVVVTVVTGVDYVIGAVRMRRASERTARKRARQESARRQAA